MNGIDFDLGFVYFQIRDGKLRASLALGYIRIFKEYDLVWDGSLFYIAYSDDPRNTKFDLLYLNQIIRILLQLIKRTKQAVS